MREPLALQALELPVKVPGVLFLGAWHAYHAPAAALARVMPKELHQQALPVEPIGVYVAQSPARPVAAHTSNQDTGQPYS
jgi:hypothetical protein